MRRLFGPEAEADPMALYEKLRAEHGPVAPVLLPGDVRVWLVLGHRENLEVARTPSLFSRDSRHWHAMREGRIGPDHPLAPLTTWQPLCVFADGMEHRRLRQALTESLSRFESRGIRRYVIRFTHQLIDGFQDTGQADLVGQFADQLPLRVITQLFGMEEEYGPRLVEAAKDMIKGTETAVASNDFITETLQRLVEHKRASPGHDVASKLLEHPARLTDDEVREHLRVTLVSANEPTVNLIANTLRMLLTDRRFRATLAGGHTTLPDALEQVLWDEPPMTTNIGRWATGDTQLAGQQIKAGDMLVLGLAAGNADPAVRPNRSVPLHGNRSHLAFSAGPHECPGRDLGRAIADTGIDTLLSRLPDLRLAVAEQDLQWDTALMSRRLVSLPTSFTPPRRVGRPKAGENGSATRQPLPPPVSQPHQEATQQGWPSVAPGAAAEPGPSGKPARAARWAAALRRVRSGR
ncbi:cytochrome P450 [Streptomyces sp. 891-h]|uniref:cytochrome P450 n=1 Tax=Streptomyces sp. 891-h TaxID=2720714 RepID=UPI001FA9B08D|nr:cytochrome P450 [Streptomyces sp. 891-h]UNZ21459.1 cytochrome P450 [Streptomyces sp. 891-h]